MVFNTLAVAAIYLSLFAGVATAEDACWIAKAQPPQGAACGFQGTLKNPAFLAGSPLGSITEYTCRQKCMLNSACRSFSYDRAENTQEPCVLYTKKPINMGKRANASATTYISARQCFKLSTPLSNPTLEPNADGTAPEFWYVNVTGPDTSYSYTPSNITFASTYAAFETAGSYGIRQLLPITMCERRYALQYTFSAQNILGTLDINFNEPNTDRTVVDAIYERFYSNNTQAPTTVTTTDTITLEEFGTGPYVAVLVGRFIPFNKGKPGYLSFSQFRLVEAVAQPSK